MTAVETIQKHREDFLSEIKSIVEKNNGDMDVNISLNENDPIIAITRDEVIWSDEFGNDYPMRIDALSVEYLAKILDSLKK